MVSLFLLAVDFSSVNRVLPRLKPLTAAVWVKMEWGLNDEPLTHTIIIEYGAGTHKEDGPLGSTCDKDKLAPAHPG